MDTSNYDAKYAVVHAQNPQVMSGTNRVLLFWSRSRCFACKTTDDG